MFEQESGQVFKEWTLRREPAEDALAGGARLLPAPDRRGLRKSVPSLVELLVDLCARAAGAMAEKHFDNIPRKLVLRIWQAADVRGDMPIESWRVLRKVLELDPHPMKPNTYRHLQHICRPRQQLSAYLSPRASPTLDFLAFVSIGGDCVFSETEILSLADLPNLAVLELLQASTPGTASAVNQPSLFPRISDRLCRGWASRDDPFPVLRVLRIWGDEVLTQESLGYLARFPSLTLLDVVAPSPDWDGSGRGGLLATTHGWRRFKMPSEALCGTAADVASAHLQCLRRADRRRQVPAWRGWELVPQERRRQLGDAGKNAVPFAHADLSLGPPDAQDDGRDDDEDSVTRRWLHGDAAFEEWAATVCAAVGLARRDDDLGRHGLPVESRMMSGERALPSRPLAVLHLGDMNARAVEAELTRFQTWRGGGWVKMAHLVYVRVRLPDVDESEDEKATRQQPEEAEGDGERMPRSVASRPRDDGPRSTKRKFTQSRDLPGAGSEKGNPSLTGQPRAPGHRAKTFTMWELLQGP